MSTERKATVVRSTGETKIEVDLSLDCAPGSGVAQVIDVKTGIGFLDHVLVFSALRPSRLMLQRCTLRSQSMAACPSP